MTPSGSDVSLLARLLALPAAERMPALERACDEDATLRGRMTEIMAELAAADDFLKDASSGGFTPDSMVNAFNLALEAAPSEAPGTRIGSYKLLQEIGRGGFGVVWMAEQEAPIRRRVALKIIKAGMDTKEVIARFEAERQALALMDHPNIARVFEAGATAAGRPYFVMELVRGLSITRYCDENRLTVEARLKLFMLVCRAVQHAHQKGIIHRDLKPSNILVTLHDGVPVPKVIDFGIAKATMSHLTDKTLFTQFHAFIGTPAYTSPEQMEMSGLDIDTRSDIYSLGVLLYELLTGRPPFDAGALVRSGLEAMRRTIREVDPPRPSHRLTTLAKEDRVTAARLRGTEASKLPMLVDGDLDWIVMRCLEKDRTRRYETANGLALDIQRHLENEPVAARPPSTAYFFRKLIRRHRLGFIAASAIAAALVLGIVASTWEAVRATRAERVAAGERGRAEDMLTFMLGDLRAQVAKVGRLAVVESVGDKATAYFASRDARNLSDTELARYSKALTQIGQIRMDQIRYDDAAAAFAEAYGRAAALAARHPQDGDMLVGRGQAEYWIAILHRTRGEFFDAEAWFARYYETCRSLMALDPSRPDALSELAFGQHNLAAAQSDKGECDSARAGFLAELAKLDNLLLKAPDDIDLLDRVATAHSWLGIVAEQQGDFAGAMKEFSTQELQLRKFIAAEPKNPDWRNKLANSTLLYETDIEMVTGQLEEAGHGLEEACRLMDELVEHDPTNRHWLAISLFCRIKEAILDRKRGDQAAASRLIDDVRPKLEKLSNEETSDRKYVQWLAMAWRVEAQLLASSDLTAASAAASRAVELVEKLIRENHARYDDVGECATACVLAGELAARAGAGKEAEGYWRKATDMLATRIRETSDWRLLDPSARAAALMGNAEEARATRSKLTQFRYIPVDPWPDTDRPAAERIVNPKP